MATPVTPSWWKDVSIKRPEHIPLQQYMQAVILNRAIPFLDPTTQAETANFISRLLPTGFQDYSQVSIPTPDVKAPAGKRIQEQADLLRQVLPTLSEQKIGKGLEPGVSKEIATSPAERDALASQLRWLQEFGKTAQLGLPQVGQASGASRAQQQFAREHLGTLMREATQQGIPSPFTALGENIFSPALPRAPLSGLVGTGRATSLPGSEYQRAGVAFRNPTFT
jgi:hypothetical protein